nr:hypothetical protein [Candidatus Sigynarchaeota archaeon]
MSETVKKYSVVAGKNPPLILSFPSRRFAQELAQKLEKSGVPATVVVEITA